MAKRDRPNFVAKLVAAEIRKDPGFEQLLVEAEAFRKSQEAKLKAEATTRSEVEPKKPKAPTEKVKGKRVRSGVSTVSV